MQVMNILAISLNGDYLSIEVGTGEEENQLDRQKPVSSPPSHTARAGRHCASRFNMKPVTREYANKRSA